MHDRVQRALARRERMRRSRDQAWMVFAGLACAALFGWILLAAQLVSEDALDWWAAAIYAAIAVVCTFLAYRAFGASRRRTRRMQESQPLESSGWEERFDSIWEEILRGRSRG